MHVKVLIGEDKIELRNYIRKMVESIGSCDVVGVARDGHGTIQMAMQLDPDVALISHDLPGMDGPKTCEVLSALKPDIMSVVLSDDTSQARMESVMRLGARALVSRPPDRSRLTALMDDLAVIRSQRSSAELSEWADPLRFPKVICVTGARGGVGKTTIATNLSVMLAKRLPNQVALLDLYTQFGDIATVFDITPKRSIVEIARLWEEMDADLLQDYITVHPSGVHIIVTATTPQPLDAVPVECLDSLLYTLRRMYRFVIVDVPPMITDSSLHVMSHSNLVLLVANLLDVTTAMDTKKLYDAIDNGSVSRDNVRIVLNRLAKASPLQVADMTSMFDCGIAAQVPDDVRLISSSNRGVPFVWTDQESSFTQSIIGLAESISGLTIEQSNARKSPKSSKLFGVKLWGNHEKLRC